MDWSDAYFRTAPADSRQSELRRLSFRRREIAWNGPLFAPVEFGEPLFPCQVARTYHAPASQCNPSVDPASANAIEEVSEGVFEFQVLRRPAGMQPRR